MVFLCFLLFFKLHLLDTRKGTGSILWKTLGRINFCTSGNKLEQSALMEVFHVHRPKTWNVSIVNVKRFRGIGSTFVPWRSRLSDGGNKSPKKWPLKTNFAAQNHLIFCEWMNNCKPRALTRLTHSDFGSKKKCDLMPNFPTYFSLMKQGLFQV